MRILKPSQHVPCRAPILPQTFGPCLRLPFGRFEKRRALKSFQFRSASRDDLDSKLESGGNGNFPPADDGRGGDGPGDDDDEFLDIQKAEELAAAKGISLPQDFAAAAASGGLRASVLKGYLGIVASGGLGALLSRSVPAFRDRLIADKLYFFKILAEITIDSGCATVAEVRKRGHEFWDEFEFYLSDMVVGLVLDVVLVSLLAPVAIVGRKRPVPRGALRQWSAKLPSAMFESSSPARKYTLADRISCWVARGLEYSLAGIVCGIIGQAAASAMMVARRRYIGSSEKDVDVPPVLQTGLVWGAFLGLSANTRYQMVFGLERIVDETIAKRLPQIAYLTTTVIRFGNNIIGGEQFIDMARWAGIQ